MNETRSENTTWRYSGKLAGTLLVSMAGAWLATTVGLPAAAIVGSAAAVSLAALARFPCVMPGWLRNMGFAAIGCSLGSGINADFLTLVVQWPASMLALAVAMLIIMLASSWLMVRFFRQGWTSALLATSPGALTYSLAMAASGIGDARTIVVCQSVRLLSITTALPLLLDLLQLPHGMASARSQLCIGWLALALIYCVALVGGYGLSRWKVPAAYLISGLAVSGLLHALGSVSGRPPAAFLTSGFVITGAVVGSRFARIPLTDLRQLLLAALAAMFAATSVSALLAWLVACWLQLPFGQVWISYAPGGVEAMAAMALALEYDSAYVATHHLFRIVLLLFLLPVVVRLVRRWTGPEAER